jgi:hypothetical protein
MPDSLRFSPTGIFADLEGAVDIHIHSTPDAFPRLLDDFEVASQARDAGMRAIVLKGHTTSTADRAQMSGRVVPGIDIFGGIVLNNPVGGLNPSAVEAAAIMGAKVVWMPTMWAENHCRYIRGQGMAGYVAIGMRFPERGITVLEEDGQTLRPEVHEILELIAKRDLVLAGGHLDLREHRVLIREARRAGVSRIVVNHPSYQPMDFSIDEQVELAEMGAYMEHCMLPLTPMWAKIADGGWPPARVAEAIKAVGAERCILSSDLGQRHNAPPVEGLRQLIQMMRESGIAEDELHLMTRVNPARLLGLPA